MKELQLQDKYLIHFFTEKADGLKYKEAKANTVSDKLFVEGDLQSFISETSLNKDSYKSLLKEFNNDENKLMSEFVDFLQERIKDSTNMAIFINNNKTVTFKGVKLHLFYPSGSEVHGNKLFEENIFSVVQELPYIFKHEGKTIYSFRPDITFFMNGIYLGYSELKSNYNNQNAKDNGRKKVVNDYKKAVLEYLKIADGNDISQTIRKDFLKFFEKAIHITTTDINDTYVIRNITIFFDELKSLYNEGKYDFDEYDKKVIKDFKSYPLLHNNTDKTERFEEVFKSLYSKEMIEKEILYYNFIEKEVVKKGSKKETKNEKGRLISPRPKQKFGTDKIISKIDEFLEHENDDDYFLNKLKEQLKNLGESQRNELISKRQKYQNNKNVYSLLLQYAAGFGKSNIIGWTTLQLKDIRRNNEYVYDKVMIIVDRIQLRDQIGNKMFNMNVNNKMFIEADSKASFLEALKSDTRIVIVNIQKFGTIKGILNDEVIDKLSKLRIAFLIDEIHRSNSGAQHEEMVNLFDELQNSFDNSYGEKKKKKNLIIGFTATPSDNTLARFGEFNKYAEAEKIWVPFDSYTMKEAIEDGYILNPLRGIVPVSAKMYFEKPESEIEGFENDLGYFKEVIPDGTDTGIDEDGKKYAIRKKNIYENNERIEAISKFIVNRLVTSVYNKIRGTGKAMLAVTSIKSAIKYKENIDKLYKEIVKENKYERFKEAPIFIVYSSDSQDHTSSNILNNGMNEEKVLQEFALAKNGLIIVVEKLQTGFDEPKLHTLFLDKEINGINAIQTISRVNRTTKYKNDCKIIDFSYKNVNVNNIKKAFDHFSNVVVSDFDPIGDEKLLGTIYDDLIKSDIYSKYFKIFYDESIKENSDTHKILDIENGFSNYTKNNPKHSKELKQKINKYYYLLNLIEFVIEIEKRYTEKVFLDFWRRFNNEYRNVNKDEEVVDDVIVYFDNKIGIIDGFKGEDGSEDENKKKKEGKVSSTNSENNQYRFNILEVIQKRNEEEEKVNELIEDFEKKIELLFNFILLPENGTRLIAKIKDNGNAFTEDEIYKDFEVLYKKFIRRNRVEVGDFFVRETQDIINQLCDDFERFIN
ncbi:DEAD/DEAH box helicase family protein [Candidatus Gracilibacteria bacterium]|nr:DEAD/DEAH box helicase family protein [Candidatus Gracilibacteria bacterium]